MAGRYVMLLAVAAAVTVAGVRAHCTHNDQCDPLSCCRVGFMRYSTPSCSSRGAVGSHCSPAYNEPSSRTLNYPNNIKVHIEEGHFGMCPCQSGLVCFRGTCQPEDNNSSPSREDNSFTSHRY